MVYTNEYFSEIRIPPILSEDTATEIKGADTGKRSPKPIRALGDTLWSNPSPRSRPELFLNAFPCTTWRLFIFPLKVVGFLSARARFVPLFLGPPSVPLKVQGNRASRVFTPVSGIIYRFALSAMETRFTSRRSSSGTSRRPRSLLI